MMKGIIKKSADADSAKQWKEYFDNINETKNIQFVEKKRPKAIV